MRYILTSIILASAAVAAPLAAFGDNAGVLNGGEARVEAQAVDGAHSKIPFDLTSQPSTIGLAKRKAASVITTNGVGQTTSGVTQAAAGLPVVGGVVSSGATSGATGSLNNLPLVGGLVSDVTQAAASLPVVGGIVSDATQAVAGLPVVGSILGGSSGGSGLLSGLPIVGSLLGGSGKGLLGGLDGVPIVGPLLEELGL